MFAYTVRALAFGLIVCLIGFPAAHAEVLRFTTTLTGAAQVPPSQSRGTGAGEFQYDTSTNQLTFAIVYQDLTGPSIAGHIHGPADAGSNAGVIIPFGIAASPINGTATLTPDQADALVRGLLYVNIHTATYKDGEIRGQIVK